MTFALIKRLLKFRIFTALRLFLSAGLLLLTFNNCTPINFGDKINGLEQTRSYDVFVGNPLRAAKTIASQVCSVITRCNNLITSTECEAGVLKTSGIDYQLGLTKGSVSSFDSIVQSEFAGSLRANSTATETCLTAVNALTCSDSGVQGAYNPQGSDPYAGVAYMIPTSPGSCPAVFNQPVLRKEFYVATSGSDQNDGSAARPWATITYAAKSLTLGADGAIVHVAPGTYTFSSNSQNPPPIGQSNVYTTRSGTAAGPITYISDQQWGAKIMASDSSTVWYNSGDYVKIVGFEIIGATTSEYGIYSDGSFNQIIGNHIHDIPVTLGCSQSIAGGGIVYGYFSQTHDNDSIGNLIHDIGPLSGNGLALSSYCDNAHGIAYRQPRGKIQNNIIYRASTWGFVTWHSANNLQIANNLFFNNGARSGNNVLVGGAISLSGEPLVGTLDDTSVVNNIIRNNSGWGLAESGPVGTRNVYINNNMFSNGTDFALASGVNPVGTLTTDPQMIDFKDNGSGNYHLSSTSPAINAGSTACALVTGTGQCTPSDDFAGFARPLGTAADLGPYEWHQ